MRQAAILLTVLALVGVMMQVEAAPRGEKYKVTVTEFGTFQGLDIDNLKVEGLEQSLYSLVIDSLLDTKKFSAFENAPDTPPDSISTRTRHAPHET